MHRRLTWLTALLLALSLLAVPAALADDDDDDDDRDDAGFVLTVLHNNDGESKLLPIEVKKSDGTVEYYGGVSRFKTLVDRLRHQATARNPLWQRHADRGVVMLSSGDNFLAGPQFQASLDKGVPYYDSIAMSLIRYDAVAIGNHEFDFGPDVLADFIRGFTRPTPFVSANLDFTGEPALQALFRPFSCTAGDDDDDDDVSWYRPRSQRPRSGYITEAEIVRTGGHRVGIVGATTPALRSISSPRNVKVLQDVAGEIQKEVDRLTACGVEKIVLISHLQSVLEDRALAPMLRGVDVMIAGGGDELLAPPGTPLVPGDVIQGPYPIMATGADGAQIPIVTTAGDYKYVGRLVVLFDEDGNVTSVDPGSGPVMVSSVGPNPVQPNGLMESRVVRPVAAYVAALAANRIGTSQVALEGRRSPGVRTKETNLGNLMADSLLWQATRLAPAFGVPVPDVALQNGGGIRNNSLIPAGPITDLTTFDIAPFANFVSVVPNVPPATFKALLENAVSRVEFGDGRFAQIAGFRFTYDASKAAGSRVVSATLDNGTAIIAGGAVVAGAPSLDVATIDFLARGGDSYPFGGLPFTTLGVTYQQALKNYIVTGLGGLITAADYPEGGEGRITRLN